MFLNPKQLLSQIETTGHEIIVDIGAGSGAFALLLASLVKKGDGHVYAVDVQKDVLLRLAHSAKEQGINNISVIHADAESSEGIPLETNISSLTIISNVLFQVDDKDQVLREASRLTHPGGLLLLLDWKDSFRGLGPEKGMIISEREALKRTMQFGFSLTKEFTPSPHHWAILLRKNFTH